MAARPGGGGGGLIPGQSTKPTIRSMTWVPVGPVTCRSKTLPLGSSGQTIDPGVPVYPRVRADERLAAHRVDCGLMDSGQVRAAGLFVDRLHILVHKTVSPTLGARSVLSTELTGVADASRVSRILTVGVGHRVAEGPIYEMVEVI